MQSFATKHLVRVDDLVERIKSTQGIEGVTLVGGEPLDQSKPLLRLVNSLKGSGLTVMLYTGYEEEGILDGDSRALVDLADIVVSGPYVEEKRDLFSQWRGSLNQKVAFKNRYSERTSESLERINEVEVHIEESGHITLIGYPVDGLKGALLR
jgi:anaerobic ribonucleoside-triphosphate reductase activating protein